MIYELEHLKPNVRNIQASERLARIGCQINNLMALDDLSHKILE